MSDARETETDAHAHAHARSTPSRVGARFEIHDEVACGAHGQVCRARDATSGGLVAVKLARDARPKGLARFELEACTLRRIRHPAVVGYVAHGVQDGRAYVVLEWIEGETLEARLARGTLEVTDALALAAELTRALEVLHGLGIIHRDLKPSNVMLRGGDPARPVLLDLGIARAVVDGRVPMDIAGTPGYVAPEQAHGLDELDARADFFALGCVLFHSLCGLAPFAGATKLSVMAKAMLLPSPSLARYAPAVPAPVVELVARLLAKNPESRPSDAAELGRLIEAVKRGEPQPPRPPRQLSRTEHEILTVIVAWGRRPGLAPTLKLALTQAVGPQTEIASCELHDSSRLVSVVTGASPATQAVEAARCALAIREQTPDLALAIATGPGLMALAVPVGHVIDEALALARTEEERCVAEGRAPRILVERTTAGLLAAEFELHQDAAGAVLVGPRCPGAPDQDPRDPTARDEGLFVGRDKELARVLAAFERARGGGCARCGVVSGPPGSGKTRLTRAVTSAAEVRDPRVNVWLGRGDALRAESPFAMLRTLARGSLGLDDDLDRLSRAEAAGGAREWDALLPLARLLVPTTEVSGPRADALVEEGRHALIAWLRKTCEAGPLLLIIDDLQWCDLPSLRILATAIIALGDGAVLVLALTRPDVQAHIRAELGVLSPEEMTLAEIALPARRELAARLLGLPVEDPAVATVVEHAGGLPLFLEEMARVSRAGSVVAVGETLSALVAARIKALPVEARALLRAGSVFGERFPVQGALALLGTSIEVGPAIRALVGAEVVRRPPGRRSASAGELVFHHAVLCEAAYSLLTDDDRRTGHRIAASWLQAAGEQDAAVLGRHLAEAGEHAAAVKAYEQAAASALGALDFGAAARLCEAGLRCASDEETRLRLSLMAAESMNWACDGAAKEILLGIEPVVPARTVGRARVLTELVVACRNEADRPILVRAHDEVVGELASFGAFDDLVATAYLRAAAALVLVGSMLGMRDQLDERLMRLLDEITRDQLVATEPRAWADVLNARGTAALFRGEHDRALAAFLGAGDAFEQAGALAAARDQRSNGAFAATELGAFHEAIAILRANGLEEDGRTIRPYMWVHAQNLSVALTNVGELDEARRLLEQGLSFLRASCLDRWVANGEMYLADLLLRQGDLNEAGALAAAAIERLPTSSPLRAPAEAILADVLLAAGDPVAALEHATTAAAILEELGYVEERESHVRLVHARALHAAGGIAEARRVLAAARDRLLERAARLPADRRSSFLQNILANRMTLALAVEWGVARASF